MHHCVILYLAHLILTVGVILLLLKWIVPDYDLWEDICYGMKTNYNTTVAILCLCGIIICVLVYKFFE